MQKFENLGPRGSRGPFLLILAKKQPIGGTVLGPGHELVCCDLVNSILIGPFEFLVIGLPFLNGTKTFHYFIRFYLFTLPYTI